MTHLRELHDEVGQALIALLLTLENVRDALPADSAQAHEMLNEATELAQRTLDLLRNMAHDLRPPTIDMADWIPSSHPFVQRSEKGPISRCSTLVRPSQFPM